MVDSSKTAKEQVLEILPRDDEVRLTARQIWNMLGVAPANVRHIVNELRSEGIPVCSDKKGYFISDTPKCIRATVNHLKHRVKKIQAALDGLERMMI